MSSFTTFYLVWYIIQHVIHVNKQFSFAFCLYPTLMTSESLGLVSVLVCWVVIGLVPHPIRLYIRTLTSVVQLGDSLGQSWLLNYIWRYVGEMFLSNSLCFVKIHTKLWLCMLLVGMTTLTIKTTESHSRSSIIDLNQHLPFNIHMSDCENIKNRLRCKSILLSIDKYL